LILLNNLCVQVAKIFGKLFARRLGVTEALELHNMGKLAISACLDLTQSKLVEFVLLHLTLISRILH
jgi:hypothetical protein